MNNPPGTDAGLKSLAIVSERFAPVLLSPRMRNRYAPVHVGQEIGAVRLLAVPLDPGATVALGGAILGSGQESAPVELRPGRNILTIEVTAADGRTKRVYQPHVFRDYPAPGWRKVSGSSPWAPRDSAGELVFGGRMWLFGGYVPATVRDVWSSADGVEWTRTGEIPTPCGVDIPLTFDFGGRMWVSDVEGRLYSSADGADWRLATDQAPWRGRNAAGAAVFNGRMWVMGGAAEGTFLNDVWSSADGVHWSLELAEAPWSRRTLHNTPLVMDGQLWLIGGAVMGDYYPFRGYRDVWCSADGRDWHLVTAEAPWVGRIWGSTAVYRDRLWLLGGFRSEPIWENLGDTWYSADGATWHRLDFPATCRHSGNHNVPVAVDDSTWAARHEMSVYTHDDRLWAVGGMVWPLMNDVWSLEIGGLSFVTQPVVEDFVGTRYAYRARADFNRRRGPVRYRLAAGPDWLSVQPKTGLVAGTAPAAGDVPIVIEAFDAAGETARQEYVLHILPLGIKPASPANPGGS